MKKAVAAFLAGAMALYSLSIPAFAAGASSVYSVVLPGGTDSGGGSVHGAGVFQGSYYNANNENLILLITPSAQTSLLNVSVYNCATKWNNISSNAKVHVYFNSMPSKLPFKTTNPTNVYGWKYTNGILGETVPYNEYGKVSPNDNWVYTSIYMNTWEYAFDGAGDETIAAQMTFVHEVGHALKLAHPKQDASIPDHSYNGYPFAVMNQGFPGTVGGEAYVASFPTRHDKECLTYKWGE